MQPSTILEDWKLRPCVIATMHKKEVVIAPALTNGLGIATIVPEDFNTDTFGTFTRDIARTGNQRDTAYAKAQAAMDHTGLDLAIVSEGSFGVHPSMPFLESNLELVMLIDQKHNLEILGKYRTSAVHVRSQSVSTADEAVSVAQTWGFPEQGVILRTSQTSTRSMDKEIRTLDELHAASDKLLSRWFTSQVFLETDMRAHRCPARMESITAAMDDLIQNCLHLCPQCATPGFVVTDVTYGLPCSTCRQPTELAMETVSSCQKCSHQKRLPATDAPTADPGQCGHCNP